MSNKRPLAQQKPKALYDKDFYKWTIDQSRSLRKGEYSNLDIDNLIEEIESLGRSERRTLESFFINLLLHLLKIKYQPAFHTSSWDASVKVARIQIEKTLAQNPSLKPKVTEIFTDAYKLARLSAVKETGIEEKVFPTVCPWTVKECMENVPFLKTQKKKKSLL
jgi:hypothetical protein